MTQDEPDQPSLPPSFRTLQILEVLAAEGRPLTATEINATMKLPVPTIHRLVGNLESEGFLSRDLDGRSYRPGPKLQKMMQGVVRFWHHGLSERSVLVRLNERLGETCNLSIPDGDAMLYIDRVETQRPLRVHLHIGSRVPLHATSAGKMSLALLKDAERERYLKRAQLKAYTPATITDPDVLRTELREIAQRGYSTDRQEFVAGMIACAVPVKNAAGALMAVLSFHAPEQRLTLEDGIKHLPQLFEAAEELSQLL